MAKDKSKTSRKIRRLVREEGYDQEQAVAIALEMERKNRRRKNRRPNPKAR